MRFRKNIYRLFVMLVVVWIALSVRATANDMEDTAIKAPESISKQVARIFTKANKLQEHQKQASRKYLSSLSDRELAEVYKKATAPQQVSPNSMVVTDSYLEKIRKNRQDIINELVERFVLDEESKKHFSLEYQKLADRLAALGPEAVPILVRHVGGIDFESDYRGGGLSKQALLKMGEKAVEPLMSLIDSKDSLVRGGAANILSKLAKPRAKYVLLRALNDEAGNVRRYAFDGLVRLGPDVVGHDKLVTILIEHLEKRDMWKAIRGLDQYGNERAIEPLQVIERFYPGRGIKSDLRYSARRAINAILLRAGKVIEEVRREDYSKEPPTYDELLAAAKCPNAAIRERAVDRLGRYKDDAERAALFLIERISKEQNPEVLDQIGRSMFGLIKQPDSSSKVVVSALTVQKAFDAFISVTKTIPAFSSKYLSVRNPADYLTPKERKLLTAAITGAKVILNAANKHQRPLKGIERFKNIVLIWGLSSNDPELKVTSYRSVITIAQLSPKTGKTWLQYQREHLQKQLTPLLESPNPNIRLIECLGYIGDKHLTPRLIKLLGHGDASVRRFAAGALGQIGDPKALPALKHLAETDPHQYESGVYGVRRAANEAKERIREKQQGSTSVAPGDIEASIGQAVNGLKALASCNADTIKVGEHVIIELYLQNVSDEEITYVDFKTHFFFGDTEVTTLHVDGRPVGMHTTLDVHDAGYKVIAEHHGSYNMPMEGVFVYPPFPIPRKAFVVLKPGEKVAYLKVDLQPAQFKHERSKQALGPLQIPGEHTIQVEYQNTADGWQFGLKAWTGKLRSNVIIVKVTRNQSADKVKQEIKDSLSKVEKLENEHLKIIKKKLDSMSAAEKRRFMTHNMAVKSGMERELRTLSGETARRMAAFGEPAVPILLEELEVLSSEIHYQHRCIARSLRQIGRPAVPYLIKALQAGCPVDKVAYERYKNVIISTLGQISDSRAVEPLLELFHNSRRASFIWTHVIATAALGNIGDKRAVEPIISELEACLARAEKNGDWDAYRGDMQAYARALGQLGDKRATSVLMRALNAGPQKTKAPEPQYLIAEEAAQALRSLGVEVTGDRKKDGHQVIEVAPPVEIMSQELREGKIPKEKLTLAADLMKQSQYDRASIELRKIAEEYSNCVDVMGVYGLLEACYKRQGLETQVVANARFAITIGKQFLESHPDQYHLHAYIGSFYSVLQEWDNTRKSFQKYIKAEAIAENKDPASRCGVYMEIAKTYENEGKWSEVVKEYQKILDDPGNPYKVLKARAQFSIAEVYSTHGIEIFGTREKAKEEALKAYQKVISLFPERECTKWREKSESRIRQLRARSTGLVVLSDETEFAGRVFVRGGDDEWAQIERVKQQLNITYRDGRVRIQSVYRKDPSLEEVFVKTQQGWRPALGERWPVVDASTLSDTYVKEIVFGEKASESEKQEFRNYWHKYHKDLSERQWENEWAQLSRKLPSWEKWPSPGRQCYRNLAMIQWASYGDWNMYVPATGDVDLVQLFGWRHLNPPACPAGGEYSAGSTGGWADPKCSVHGSLAEIKDDVKQE